jgi:hypothetical protein
MILLILISLTILLKSLTNSLVYKGWTEKLNNKYPHWVELIMIFSAFLTGCFFGREIISLRFLYLFLSTAFIYAGSFDFLYGLFSGNWAKNKNLIWDRLRIKYPFMDNYFFRVALILIGLYLFTKTNIS